MSVTGNKVFARSYLVYRVRVIPAGQRTTAGFRAFITWNKYDCVTADWPLPFLASLSIGLPKYRSVSLVFSYFDDPNLISTHTHCLLTEQPACRCSITIAAVRCTRILGICSAVRVVATT